jgi:hypothetical protein
MTKKSTFLITPLPVKPKIFNDKFFVRVSKESDKLTGPSFKDSRPDEARKSTPRERFPDLR